MSRLTNYVIDSYIAKKFSYDTVKNMSDDDFKAFDEIVQKLGRYEDLEEQGRLIELPCKVGDAVWWVEWEYNEWYEKEYFIDESVFDIEDFCDLGSLCFLTKEEAEKALEKLKGDET